MRHGDKINNLGRTASHRNALLVNLACQLFEHKKIVTTLAKAKALRPFVEPLITKSKENTTHQRRLVFSRLQDKAAVKELFDVISLKIASRPGGYTRVIKLGRRVGDNAELALIELVDYNEIYGKAIGETETAGAKKTRRAGRSKKASEAREVTETQPAAEAKPKTPAKAGAAEPPTAKAVLDEAEKEAPEETAGEPDSDEKK
jgi:large subunit ribosomal protein L17